ncbi:uncharacterized protein HKW66_Vig0002780 [Vigna angularis]|uniref:Legume lectin domain-containing protein n=1 Tax=Phaseolus angularis TaxID=3914 RepID=A0A8T0LH06_PHAAN|nr:uncharacterized protein HKW66_Vig0002780 [Vigna angularis]
MTTAHCRTSATLMDHRTQCRNAAPRTTTAPPTREREKVGLRGFEETDVGWKQTDLRVWEGGKKTDVEFGGWRKSENGKISRLDLAGEVFHVPLTNPSLSSSGLLRVPEPLVFVDATTTLSTEFSFSISGNGDNVLFVLTAASANGSDTVAVEFVRFKDENVGDPNSSDVGIDVGSHLSLAVANASYVVRLSKWGEQKPSDREEEEEDGEGNEDDDAHASDISPGREDGHEQSVGNFHT